MPSDFEIGRVIAVDTAQVTIQLNEDLKGLTRTTYEGPHEVARINSYVILPVGGRSLVAMVNRVVLTEEAEVSPGKPVVTLPAARRIVKATLIGTIDGDSFAQGISVFPILDNPVHLVNTADLDAVFGRIDGTDEDHVIDPGQPGYCLEIGRSAVFERRPIRIDPDAMFGKHLAVLGSTGSGKSCTVATIIQAILDRGEVRRTRVVILDTNGEYRSAFQRRKNDGSWEGAGNGDVLYVPSDMGAGAERVVIPYWFMNADDYVRLFKAKEGLQAPVLLRALRLARARHAGQASTATTLEILRLSCTEK